MGSLLLDALKSTKKYGVGNLNSLKIKTVAHGAQVVDALIENFTLGQLGFNEDGQRTVTQKGFDKAKKSVLVTSPEARYMGESMNQFYNGVGEFARCVILEEGYTRFDTSSFTKNTGVTEVKNGQVAHFDGATKKFIVSDAGTPHADYADSANQFIVVAETDGEYGIGDVPMVRLEVTKA